MRAGCTSIQRARDDTRDETRSTVALTAHFLDAQLDLFRDQWNTTGYTTPQFRLRELGGIRHLNVRFFDTQGHLLESNEGNNDHNPTAPRWFSSLIPLTSQPLQSVSRAGLFQRKDRGPSGHCIRSEL